MKKIFKVIIFSLILYFAPALSYLPFLNVLQAQAIVTEIPQVESEETPDIRRFEPLDYEKLPTPSLDLLNINQADILAPEAVNLVENFSIEEKTSSGLPLNWYKGGYGSNVRVLTYPVTGYGGSQAIKVELTERITGDAKWFFADVPVNPGETYVFSNYYISSVPSIIDARYLLADGTYKYIDLLRLEANPNSDFKKAEIKFVVPENVVSLTIFHLIQEVGFLTTDEYKLIADTPPAPDLTNYIPNAEFELVGTNALPLAWKKGGWGTNTRSYSYPVNSYDNSQAVRVNISNYTSGDAKWYFIPIELNTGTYTYTDNYSSDVTSIITVQFQNADNTYTYKDMIILPPTNSFMQASVDFYVPVGTKNVTVFHLIKNIGFLALDNVSLRVKAEETGIFDTGAVTFRFDDGWDSQYYNALPKLNSAGIKGTFFITTHQLLERGYAGFMNESQLLDLHNSGHEIGAHTRTHPYLTELTSEEQREEIQGSKFDLEDMGLGPISTFSYPFGDYSQTTIQIVKEAGFSSAVSVIDGYVVPASDKFQLERMEIVRGTTLKQIQGMIDKAAQEKKWLIFELHEINNSGKYYSLTQETFDYTVDYVVEKEIPVITISEGLKFIP